MVKTVNICDVPVSSVNIPQACEVVDGWIIERKKAYVCVAPVSTIVDSQSNQEYKKVLEGADMITPDGMPLVWTAKLMGDKTIERTYGPDLMLALCGEGQKKGYNHYLYGGTENTCSLLKNILKRDFPDIKNGRRPLPPPLIRQSCEKLTLEETETDVDVETVTEVPFPRWVTTTDSPLAG